MRLATTGPGVDARARASPLPPLPRFRAPLVFAFIVLLFAGLAGRSLYLQWIDNEFLQEQGSSRYSREIELPAHRGRIVDRYGEALAISTPVKSIWAFPAKVEATPEQLAALASLLETSPQALAQALAERAISCSSRGRCRRKSPSASRASRSRGSTTRTSTAASTRAARR